MTKNWVTYMIFICLLLIVDVANKVIFIFLLHTIFFFIQE